MMRSRWRGEVFPVGHCDSSPAAAGKEMGKEFRYRFSSIVH